MIENNLFLLVSVIFIILGIVIIFLFMNHLKFMRIFIEEIRRDQLIAYKEISNIKKEIPNHSSRISLNESSTSSIKKNSINNIQEISHNNLANNNQENLNVKNLKSSKVSEEELIELLKGTEQIFSKEINIDNEQIFTDINIDIRNN